jgi:O-acetylhomoserine (thiol)-lyase
MRSLCPAGAQETCRWRRWALGLTIEQFLWHTVPRAAPYPSKTMPVPKPPGFETLSLHAGQHPDAVTGARAVPIYQTTSYVFADAEHAAALFNLERAGHIYTRISNPTTAVLEERLAALEGGVGAICTASGMAAMHLSIATLLGAGDHIIASASLYGGTINLLAHTLPRFGITTTFVKPRELAQFRAAIEPNTRLLIGETIGNPGLEVLDIPQLAQIAHEAKIPLLIDNTFATPYLSRPIEFGADIVMNSATKWIGGHGIAIGGVIVDGGAFDWRGSGKFPQLTQPYAGYHGMVFDEQFGPAAFIMRARTEGLRDFGACLSPTNAFQLLQGVETLGIRMERHIANTHAVLEFLTASKAVDWVLHPALENHPDHELAKRLLPRGAGSIISFGIKGGRPAGRKFIESLRMISHLANVGDAKTLVIHPASTTHQQMDAAQLAAAGIGEELVRLSIGIESQSDIVDDLAQALRMSQKA